jgi:hypothetical protein
MALVVPCCELRNGVTKHCYFLDPGCSWGLDQTIKLSLRQVDKGRRLLTKKANQATAGVAPYFGTQMRKWPRKTGAL